MSEGNGDSRCRFMHRLIRSGCGAFVLLLALVCTAEALPQSSPDDETALRDRAFLLWDQNDYTDALPLLEELALARPTDVAVLERLAGALAASARDVADPEARKEVILRARSLLLRAKELGGNSGYLSVMLEQLPENGEMEAFSTQKEVDEAVRQGETAFAKSDFAAAIAAYQRALQLDPHNYAAALFTGDVYYRMNQMDMAAVWFARAIKINLNRETAYRYWGDALMKADKMEEARDKFVDAVVAEPYIKAPWIALQQWVGRNDASLAHPKIEPHGSVSVQGDRINIMIDPASLDKKGGGNYWMMYPMVRALWHGDKFAKEFPDEKIYRHSLREEVEALETVADMVSEDAKKKRKRKKLDPQLLTLLDLRNQGLLEAYVLLSCADRGIAQDYPAYRAVHREKLVQYISEWLIVKGASKK